MNTEATPVVPLDTPTPWRSGFIEIDLVRGGGSPNSVAITAYTEDGEGLGFSVGLIVPAEVLTLALAGLTEQKCQLRVYDVGPEDES